MDRSAQRHAAHSDISKAGMPTEPEARPARPARPARISAGGGAAHEGVSR